MAFSTTKMFLGYCGLKTTTEEILLYQKITVYLGLIDIDQKVVVATTVRSEPLRYSNKFFSEDIENVNLKFVEDHLVLTYKIKFRSSSNHEAFKIVYKDDKVSLKGVQCLPQCKYPSTSKSKVDTFYFRNRFLYVRNEKAPDSILGTLPFPYKPKRTYSNGESGTFISGEAGFA